LALFVQLVGNLSPLLLLLAPGGGDALIFRGKKDPKSNFACAGIKIQQQANSVASILYCISID